MSTLAELGEIAKAADDRDKGISGWRIGGAGAGLGALGLGVQASGSKKMIQAMEPHGGAPTRSADIPLAARRYSNATGEVLPGTSRYVKGRLISSPAKPLMLLGAGAGLANYAMQRKRRINEVRSKRARQGAATRQRNERMDRYLASRS